MWCFHAAVLEVFGSPSVLAIQASASAHFAPPSNLFLVGHDLDRLSLCDTMTFFSSAFCPFRSRNTRSTCDDDDSRLKQSNRTFCFMRLLITRLHTCPWVQAVSLRMFKAFRLSYTYPMTGQAYLHQGYHPLSRPAEWCTTFNRSFPGQKGARYRYVRASLQLRDQWCEACSLSLRYGT